MGSTLASITPEPRPLEGYIAMRSNKGMEQTSGAMSEMAAPLTAHPQRWLLNDHGRLSDTEW
jgi:hypothetical protein